MTKRKKSKRDELGPDSAGQSGDTQQISDTASADSESVEELAEEGNAFEADAVHEWRTRKMPTSLKSLLGKFLKTMFLASTWTMMSTSPSGIGD